MWLADTSLAMFEQKLLVGEGPAKMIERALPAEGTKSVAGRGSAGPGTGGRPRLE